MKTFLQWISLVCLMLITGCGLDGPVPRKPQTEAAAPASQPAETKPDEADKTPTEKANADKVAAQDASTQKPATEKTPGRTRSKTPGRTREKTPDTVREETPGTVREKAAVGMGEKGRGYGGGIAGIITTPIHVMFTAQETITLQRIDEATKYYRAEHDGQPPKTQDEFMDKIIKANNIRLPTLPQGERYVYDPKTGELMIEKPNNQ